MKNNTTKNMLTNSNSKIKKTSKINNVRLFEFNLPAIKTCPFAKDCVSYCYADKGTYLYKNVQNKYRYNLEQTKNAIQFQIDIQTELYIKKVEYVRIHSSGDFYSLKYLKQWIAIAQNNKNIVFYGYTKSVPLFKKIDLPSNFIFCFSYGGKFDHLITKKDRHAKIFNNINELKNARYIDCSVNDMKMISTNKIGLISH